MATRNARLALAELGIPATNASLSRLSRGTQQALVTELFTNASKNNARQTKQLEGQTTQLPGMGGVMPGTPGGGNFTLNLGGFPGGSSFGFPGGVFTGGGTPLNLGIGDIVGGIGAATGNCENLPSPLKEICKGAGVVFGKPGTEAGTQVQPATCPPGTVKVGNTCVSPGDVFPGGAPFLQEAGGQATVGAFGLPALSPTIVGSVANNRGEVSPIRRCPRGMVLGFDELCYPKAVLPRRSRFRKHKGARKPPMSGADAAALRRIGTLKNRVKDLAKDAGLSCSTRSSTRRRK